MDRRVQRIEPGPGQESVWDYPRPPRLEPVTARLRVVLGGITIADTVQGLRVLETSHPPDYYIPMTDVVPGALVAADGASWCEWKGVAHYYDVHGGGQSVSAGAWGYDDPTPPYRQIAGTVAFYPGLMDSCWVDDEQVRPQAGGFYGGWITSNVVGPFKGEPGTRHW